MNIFAIVVTYNGMQWADRCFSSLERSELPVQTIAIDNASTDGTPDYIKSHFPSVHLVESHENLGFAKSNNIGFRYALDHGADYVFLLNHDAWIFPNTLQALVQTMEAHPDCGIASPIHLNGDSTAIDRRFCSALPPSFTSDLYYNHLQPIYELDHCNAAAWLISAACLKKIGGFDTSLFIHYGEDDNYCQRVHYHHLRILLNPTSTICHDRVSRDLDDSSRQMWKETIRKEEIAERWSNINIDYPMRKIYRRLKLKRLLSLPLSSNRRSLNETLAICRQTMRSREINKQEGLHWL